MFTSRATCVDYETTVHICGERIRSLRTASFRSINATACARGFTPLALSLIHEALPLRFSRSLSSLELCTGFSYALLAKIGPWCSVSLRQFVHIFQVSVQSFCIASSLLFKMTGHARSGLPLGLPHAPSSLEETSSLGF